MLKSFNNKIIKIFLYIVIALFLVLSIYRHTYQIILQNNYTEAFDRSVEQYNLSISDFFSNLESAAEMLSQNEMIQYVSDDPEQYYDSTLDLLKTFYQVYDATAFAYFAPDQKIFGTKKLISWPDTSEELSNTSWDATQRPWYINAIHSNNNFAWTEPYVDTTTNKHVITLSKTVFDKSSEFKGVLAIDIDLDDLSEKINALKKYNQGSMFIILKTDEQHFFTIDTLDNNISKTLFSDELIHQLYQHEFDSFDFENKSDHFYISYATNPITGWKVIGVIEKNKFTKATTGIIINILVGILIIVLISIISLKYIQKQIGSTIQILSGSILANEDHSISQFPQLNLFQMDQDDLIFEESTSHINLLFHIEAEKENIGAVTQNLTAIDIAHLKTINISLSKLFQYKNALNVTLKSHEIQVISINQFLMALQEHINRLKPQEISNGLQIELKLFEQHVSRILSEHNQN